MTRMRVFGSDKPFCDWVRHCRFLPSSSFEFGVCIDDVDLIVHVYKTPVDAVGTREVQSLMFLEVKTRGGELLMHQQDTLKKLNWFRGIKNGVRHFGVSVLKMSGTTPIKSQNIWWGRFKNDSLAYRKIDVATLIELLKFNMHPDNLGRRPFRRHHKTQTIVEQETTPLGFVCDLKKTKRS